MIPGVASGILICSICGLGRTLNSANNENRYLPGPAGLITQALPDGARSRTDAGSGTLVARVARDQVLKATVRKGDYYFVTLPDGRTGWVSRNSIVVQN